MVKQHCSNFTIINTANLFFGGVQIIGILTVFLAYLGEGTLSAASRFSSAFWLISISVSISDSLSLILISFLRKKRKETYHNSVVPYQTV